MSCKYCTEKDRVIDDENIIEGGYPLRFDLTKCAGWVKQLTYINIKNKELKFSHYIRGGFDSIDMNKIKINYCPICGKKL